VIMQEGDSQSACRSEHLLAFSNIGNDWLLPRRLVGTVYALPEPPDAPLPRRFSIPALVQLWTVSNEGVSTTKLKITGLTYIFRKVWV